MPARVPAEVAVAVMRGAGLEPLDPYISSKAKWRCRCTTCRAIVFPIYNQVQQGAGGCNACGIRRRSVPRVPTVVARREFAAAGATLIGEFTGGPSACRRNRLVREVAETRLAARPTTRTSVNSTESDLHVA